MKVLKFKSFDDNTPSEGMHSVASTVMPNWGISSSMANSNYLQEYLKTVIGRFVKVDFLIGNDTMTEREGILKEVGTDYIVLEMLQSNDLLVCDLYSVKFVEII